MKILLYGINYSPELTGAGKYSGEMAAWMTRQGHEVRVITAPPYYPDWKVWQGFSSWRYSVTRTDGISVYRCPLYVPARPTTLKRLLHLASFSLSSSVVVVGQVRWKPDVIILVVPTLFCALQSLLLAKLSGATSVLHIQDYEVDAMFELGSTGKGGVRSVGVYLESLVLKAFDRVATISSAMISRARTKGVNAAKLLMLPNWSEVSRFRNVPRSPELLQRLGVDSTQRVLLYSGNLGDKQGLELLVEAAEHLAHREDLTFLIVGEGASRQRLMDDVKSRALTNVVFAPLQPYADLPALLASADCHLIVQKRGVADLVLPSKLTNILAVGGNAVITATADTTLGQLCDEYPGIAIRVEPESVPALVAGIETCLAMAVPNSIAMGYATDFLDKERILSRFMWALGAQGKTSSPLG